MSAAESQSELVLTLAEEFLDRYRRGERPALKEYIDQNPHLANEIRDVFPAMALMENIALADESVAANPATNGHCPPPLQQLGDFRIIREVGRGGMGIVYEAEQVSLGRHVALKVLPRQVIRDAKLRQRFEREAKSAAKLHHTNIVPVYGVGEHDGTPYYVMQFIQGLGLDEVIAELGRMAPGGPAPTTSGAPGRSAAARAAARSMMTGEFAAGAEPAGVVADPAADTLTAHGGFPDLPPAAMIPLTGSGHGTTARRLDPAVLSSVTLPGQNESGTGRKSKKLTYWQSVARVGVQVADALEHAHRQGVIHRDVKPSNLLLDLGGTVWVTDFGLAKADDQQNLTHTGDILGTLRYMPPEAFEGKADARGDVYSLGLTLYELAAGRPAFDEKDRLGLVRQVTEEEPPPLRKLRPELPRDLETVIYKAIEKSPVHRYQSAADLAADLQRFLDDEPIQARRLTGGERAWRWCRRHPLEAALIAAVQATLVGLLVLGAWSNARISRALTEKEQALTDKGAALAETEAARGEAVKLRDAAVAETYKALLSETKALRLARASGWRYEALQKLNVLAHLQTPQRDLAALRGEAIACIGEFDAFEVMRLLGHTGPIWSIDFSPDGAQLATAGYDGRLQIWDVNEGRQAREIVDSGVTGSRRHLSGTMLPAVRFHPDGKHLAYATWRRGVNLVDLGDTAKPAVSVGTSGAIRYLSFSPKGRLLAVSWGDGRVGLYDADSGTLKREMQTGAGTHWYFPVAVSPDGDRVAVIGPNETVQLHNVANDEEVVSLGRHQKVVRSLSFNQSGDLLASASEDNTVKLWDVRGKNDPLTLQGHTARVNCVAFSPDGKLVASAGDDNTVRLWDARHGQPIMVLQPAIGAVLAVAFSPDGRRLAAGGAHANAEVCIFQLTSRLERRRFAGHDYAVHGLAFHPLKPLLASGSGDKTVFIWDTQSGQPRLHWAAAAKNPVQELVFAPDGSTLAVGLGKFNTASGADYSVGLRDPETGVVRRRLEGPKSSINVLSFDSSGHKLTAGTGGHSVFVWDVPTGTMLREWQGKQPVIGVGFAGHGSQVVSADEEGQINLRDVAANTVIGTTSIHVGVTALAVAPGGGEVAVGDPDGTLHVLKLPGLEPRLEREMAHNGSIRSVVYSPDGRLLATGGGDAQVVLWDARTYERLCALPQQSGIDHLAFDSDGLRLAVSTADESVGVWNLALVRPELAAIGLDWDAPLPEATLHGALAATQPPQNVRVVQATLRPINGAASPATSEMAKLRLLYLQGKYQEVIDRAEAALKKPPLDKEMYLAIADSNFQMGRYDKAAVAAQRHLELCPDCAYALRVLANSRAAEGNYAEAFQLLERVLRISPNQPLLANNLAWMLVMGPEGTRNPERALQLAQQAVTLAPKATYYQHTLGVVYYRLGKFDKAIETLRAVSDPKAPKEMEALTQFFLAMSYYKLGDTAKAKECFERAPRISPEDHAAPDEAKEVETTRVEAAALLGLK